MYDELITELRHYFEDVPLVLQAADAIEELSAAVEGYEANTNMVFDRSGNNTVVKFEPKWIPVTERLPENDQDVLVWVSIGKAPIVAYDVDCYNKRAKRWVCFDNDVTHWMTLPQPPEEGE